MLSDRYLNDGIPTIPINDTQKEYLKVFRDKCNAGYYKQESYGCECGNDSDFEILSEKDRYGLPVRTVICPYCGLVMTNPRMTAVSYDRFYESEYPFIYRAIKKPDDEYLEKRIVYGRGLVNFIEQKVCLHGKDILEIGCAGGGIVKAFEERGYNAAGVDLSSEYVKFGLSKGINIRCCHSEELLKESKMYDLIILNHVLEHFTNLQKELHIVHKLLKPEGVLFIAVPGIKNLERNYQNDFLLFLQNAHVYHFTKDTLIQVLRKYGFKVVYANEKIEAIFTAMEDECENFERENYYSDIIKFLTTLEHCSKDTSVINR